jgi:hypothetical protein
MNVQIPGPCNLKYKKLLDCIIDCLAKNDMGSYIPLEGDVVITGLKKKPGAAAASKRKPKR